MMSRAHSRGDVHDAARERQHVLGFAEQRIGRRVHAVKRQSGLILARPERRFGAEQVHLVPALGEALGQLRGHNPAAADRGITDNADIHGAAPAQAAGAGTATRAATAP